jgi:hypothetical protein
MATPPRVMEQANSTVFRSDTAGLIQVNIDDLAGD